MSYDEFGGRRRPLSSTPPIVGSPVYGAGFFDNVAQSYRSNQFRPPSPISRPTTNKSSELLKKHKVAFNPVEPITHLAASSNQVVIATKDKRVQVVETSTSKQTDCDIARYLGNKLIQAKLHKVFIDPTGKFTIISLAYATDNQPMENLLYVKRIQPLPRLKGHLITAVAWNYPKTNSDDNQNSTGTILLGTSKGLILQTELIHSDETKFFPLSPGPRQYVKEIFDVGSEVGSITGLECHQIPSSSQTEKEFIIIISTSSRLFRIVGSVPANVDPVPLHTIFPQCSSNYQDVPGRLNNAKLDLFYPAANSPPTKFAWLTEPGVMVGEVPSQLQSAQKLFELNDDINIIPYSTSKESDLLYPSGTPSGMSPQFLAMAANYHDKPISVAMSNFHVVVLFRNCMRAICILNNATVYEEYFSEKHGNIQGMSKDPIKNLIWVYCERAIFRYKIFNENKNVWKIYLDQEKFDLAKKYSANNEANYDRVICEEAQHYFKNGQYEMSAEIFAMSKRPLEEVSLMFMEIKCVHGLKRYLTIRLERLDPGQATQLTMILGWLLELIISSISVAKTLPETEIVVLDLYTELEEIFAKKQVVECLKQHPELFYGIIRNYSELDTFVPIAKLIGDFGKVVQHYMDSGQYKKALDVIKFVKRDEYFYTHGHILMKKMPKDFVDALIDQPTMKPSKLIPILLQENPYFNKCAETIRYLEHCVNVLMTDSRPAHNYLFELYARHKDEDTLLKFMEKEILADGVTCYLDLQLCLRLCTELKLVRSCVSLYSSMELHDEALNLALTIDLELAKTIAKRADSEDHQKRLWLFIAQNVLASNPDIQIATDLLRECRLLKIEDILPFFPDYTTIDFFKDAIRQSLKEYSNEIALLKDGTYDTIAEEIRGEIKAFRNRYSIIKTSQRCEICSQNLVSRAFFVFPCGHLFHSDCIVKEIMSVDPNYKGVEEKLRQLTLENKPNSAYSKNQNFAISSITSRGKTSLSDSKERLINELEQIISSECVFCGSLLASQIDNTTPDWHELDV